jgi:hypothetical protein
MGTCSVYCSHVRVLTKHDDLRALRRSASSHRGGSAVCMAGHPGTAAAEACHNFHSAAVLFDECLVNIGCGRLSGIGGDIHPKSRCFCRAVAVHGPQQQLDDGHGVSTSLQASLVLGPPSAAWRTTPRQGSPLLAADWLPSAVAAAHLPPGLHLVVVPRRLHSSS